uniref:Bromo domain-containing protein n=1 Tax=Macrostomum lignano TaxID=282301 RepID=A0A1I8H7I8_9PLAT
MAPKKTGRKPKRVTFGRPFESKKKPAAAIDCKTGEPVVAAPEPETSTPAVATVETDVKNFMVAAAAAAAAAGEDKEVVKGDATVDCELRNAAAALQECGLCDDTRGVATLEDDTEDRGSLATLQIIFDKRWQLSWRIGLTARRTTLGISEAFCWKRDLLEKTKRKGEYVSDHVASAAARLLGIEIYVYQNMDAGSNLDGIYLGPSVHVRQSSRLATVDDGAAKIMPPPPPEIPMQSVAQKVQEWKEVKYNRRACKTVPGAAATDVENKFSIRVDENRFNVLWNVDLDAEEEEPTLSVCSGDDSTSKVSSSVSRWSRRNRSVPSCPTRRSSRLSAKACSSSSNASVLSSAEASDSCASSVVRRRKRVVKPGSPTRRSERLLAKKRRMEEGDDASSVGTSNLSSIGAAAESDKVSCIAREEEFELASVVLEESNDHQRPTTTKPQQRGGQNEASPTKCRRKPDNLEQGRSSPRKKARIEQQQQQQEQQQQQQQQQQRVEIEFEVPEIQ